MKKKIALILTLLALILTSKLALKSNFFHPEQWVPKGVASTLEIKSLQALMEIVASEKKSLKPISTPTKLNSSERSIDETTRIQQDLFENDICAFFRINPDSLNLNALEENLLHNKDLIPHRSEESTNFYSLFHPGDPKLINRLAMGGPDFLRFYNALLLAGLLEGVPTKKLDLPTAERLMNQLANESPSNGVFHYFLINILEQLGRPEAEIVKEISLTLKAPYFDTRVLRITKRLWEKGIKNIASMRVATLLISEIPFPFYLPSYQMILKSLESHPELRQPALGFGKLLMKKGIRNSQKGTEIVDWLGLEYALGNQIYLKAWSYLYPGREPSPQYKRSFKDLVRAKVEYDHLIFPNKEEVFNQIEKQEDYCPRDILEKEFARLRRDFVELNQNESD